eukprot:CAMPEP_0197439818 /NCGR_PEP_ID=MMETSP1175-20131217/6475_1 /TAXON_ID=1003142 /ORGANISM="Triceratium dubium, Strain CCMP147" /LENGTH=858 /DNA_ID=CAMNT_0042969803 /DNA_START=41 /DNA_END=2617 /DNA_ORIENTATION=-
MTTLTDLKDIELVSAGFAGAGIALIVAFMFYRSVLAYQDGNESMRGLQKQINAGARAFLNTEYTYLAGFVTVIGVALCVILIQDDNKEFGLYTAICFVVGAFASACAGYIGMIVATTANSRTTAACQSSLADGLKVAFASGAVMSFTVVGLGLLGLSIMYMIFRKEDDVWNYISGFGFGASSIALFARVAGGVFTKAADVGADLVGKTEARIPEDDPRNPAVIADNVGDNVGDVAGMGADLFESYVGSIIATATLASTQFSDAFGENDVSNNAVALPFWIAGGGILASLAGVIYVRNSHLDASSTLDDLLAKLRTGIAVAFVGMIAVSIFCCVILFETDLSWRLVGCVLIGLVSGIIIGTFTEYCTSYEESPTRDIAAASEFGPAPVIIKGLGVGMLSVVVPSVVLGAVIISCNYLVGLYGISLSAVGMLSTLGITLATDAYGPVADNAGGIAEMARWEETNADGEVVVCKLDGEVRERTDLLDSLGNTTAATGKGFAIGSAVLTSVGLLVAFMQQSGLGDTAIDMKEPVVLAGLLLGAMLPFIFAAMTMLSVDKSARAIISEVRHQFASAPELLKGAVSQTVTVNGETVTYPDAARCVAIASRDAIQEMVLPGAMAVFTPPAVGFLLGTLGLAGLLGGSLTSGFMLALTMANAGGAWDNSKKWVEKCGKEGEPVIDANGNTIMVYYNFGMKKGDTLEETTRKWDSLKANQVDPHASNDTSNTNPMLRGAMLEAILTKYHERHAAAVTGDTVGDPFKDTSGPALNILIKLMSVVSLVLAPAFRSLDQPERGFGEWGVIIAILIICVGTFLLSLIVRYNARSRAAEEAEKEALAQKVLSGDEETADAADVVFAGESKAV